MSKIISIANHKGGVGKTTTAINLAAALGLLEKKCLVIDLDPQANATTGFNIKKEDIKYGSFHFFQEKRNISEYIIQTNAIHVDIIPTTIKLAAIELGHIKNTNLFRLKEALKTITPLYDYILIDCSPSLGLLTLNALNASNTVLIPIQSEFYAFQGLVKLFKTIKKIQQNFNPDIDIEGILVTMHNYRLNNSQNIINELKIHFENMVFNTIIERDINLSEAPSFGKSILSYKIDSKGAKQYLALAGEIIQNRKKNTNKMKDSLGKNLTDVLNENKDSLDFITNLNNQKTEEESHKEPEIKHPIKSKKNTSKKVLKNDYEELIGKTKEEIKETLGLSYNDIYNDIWMFHINKKIIFYKKNYLYLYFVDNQVDHFELRRTKLRTN